MLPDLKIDVPELEPDPVLLVQLSQLSAASVPIRREAPVRALVAVVTVLVLACFSWLTGTLPGVASPFDSVRHHHPVLRPAPRLPVAPPSATSDALSAHAGAATAGRAKRHHHHHGRHHGQHHGRHQGQHQGQHHGQHPGPPGPRPAQPKAHPGHHPTPPEPHPAPPPKPHPGHHPAKPHHDHGHHYGQTKPHHDHGHHYGQTKPHHHGHGHRTGPHT